MSTLTLAQFSDCHLYGQSDAIHLGANVYQNLVRVLTDIKTQDNLDFVIFSGDLSQDHSEQSYQLFVEAWQQSQLTVPLLYLPGNHDNPELLQRYLAELSPLSNNSELQVVSHQKDNGKQAQLLTSPFWQLVLMDSQSDTPAGCFPVKQYQQLSADFSADKHQFLLMHHHPVDVGYFIDQHGLTNQQDFWQALATTKSIKAIACGHIHRGSTIKAANKAFSGQAAHGAIDLYTCPATSVQFDTHPQDLKATSDGPGYRMYALGEDGIIDSQVIMLAPAHSNQ